MPRRGATGERRMLSSFTLKNFKSYREATLQLSPLTVLIGANASGKSNLIEALRLLSWIAQGNKLGSIRYTLRESDSPIRGAVGDLFRGGKRRLQLSCKTTCPDWDSYEIEVERTNEDELRIASEALAGSAQQVPLFETVAADKATGLVWAAYNNFARGGQKPEIPCRDQEAVLIQIQSPARFERRHEKSRKTILDVAGKYQGWLSNILFLDPRPSLMRAYGFKTDRTPEGSGANLSGVLYNLCRTPTGKKQVLEFVEALPEQDIRDIGFVETPHGGVMVELTETFGGRDTKCDATKLSDGTLRVLAIAAAVLAAPENSIAVIEEIDNGVHPGRAKRLLKRLSSIAEERSLHILLSSHNPALLDALPIEATPYVVFCYRDPKNGSSRLIRLEDIEDYPGLVAQGPVGDLLTRGIIDRFAKDDSDPEDRIQRGLAWLSELREQVG